MSVVERWTDLMSGRWPLIAVLLLGAAVRVYGIGFGLPHPVVRPDEEILVSTALRFFGGDFNPRFFEWPSLYFYFVHGIMRLAYVGGRLFGTHPDTQAFVDAVTANPSWVHLMLRFVSVGCGVLTIAVVARTTRALFDGTTALIAAFFLAVAFLHVRDSHFGVLDVPVTLLIMTVVALLVGAFSRFSWAARFLLAGACAGIATSIKYNAAAVAATALVVAGLGVVERPPIGRMSSVAALVVFGTAGVLCFVAGTPYSLLDSSSFVTGLTGQSSRLLTGHGVRVEDVWERHVTFSLRYGLGLPLLITALAGVVMLAIDNWRKATVLTAFPLLYFIVIGAGHTAFIRYVVPLVPFLCITAAVAMRNVERLLADSLPLGWSRAGLITIVILVAAPSLQTTARFDYLSARPDTRLLAARWLANRMAPGDTLYESGWGYAHPHLAWGKTKTDYVLVALQPSGSGFIDPSGAIRLPDWVVIAISPLRLYTSVSAEVRSLVRRDYELVGRITSARGVERESWFDRQDAFFLPFADLRQRVRPGPDFDIYRRKSRADQALDSKW